MFLANKCAECNITAFCDDQDDFTVLLENLSVNALELINESFCVTTFTEKCMNTCWNMDILNMYTFRKNTSRITQDELHERIE